MITPPSEKLSAKQLARIAGTDAELPMPVIELLSHVADALPLVRAFKHPDIQPDCWSVVNNSFRVTFRPDLAKAYGSWWAYGYAIGAFSPPCDGEMIGCERAARWLKQKE